MRDGGDAAGSGRSVWASAKFARVLAQGCVTSQSPEGDILLDVQSGHKRGISLGLGSVRSQSARDSQGISLNVKRFFTHQMGESFLGLSGDCQRHQGSCPHF